MVLLLENGEGNNAILVLYGKVNWDMYSDKESRCPQDFEDDLVGTQTTHRR